MIHEDSEKTRVTARAAFATLSVAFLSVAFSLAAYGPKGLFLPLPVLGAVFAFARKRGIAASVLVVAILTGVALSGGAFSLERLREARFLRAVETAVPNGQSVEIFGTVQRVTNAGAEISTADFGISGSVFVRLSPGSKPEEGDGVRANIRHDQKPASAFEESLRSKGTAVEFAADRIDTVRPVRESRFGKIREYLSSLLKRLYPPEESALARGMVTGDGRGISEAASKNYRKSGLSHLVVASGGNIALFSGILFFFVKSLEPRIATILLLSGIW
jgi:hypothetical protein